MDFQQTDYGNSSDGFYNTNYDQSYGFDNNQQHYGGYNQAYNQQQYPPQPQQPQVFSPSFPPEPKVNGAGGSGFEDEPPLLEGNIVYTLVPNRMGGVGIAGVGGKFLKSNGWSKLYLSIELCKKISWMVFIMYL